MTDYHARSDPELTPALIGLACPRLAGTAPLDEAMASS